MITFNVKNYLGRKVTLDVENYNECLSNNLNCDKNLPIKIKFELT